MTLNKIDRECVSHAAGLRPGKGPRALYWGRGAAKEPTAPKASRNTYIALLGGAVGLPSAPRAAMISKSTRLSATDISALASMKNVAKCDTWCELQNPANHRVFERKLRPRPFG